MTPSAASHLPYDDADNCQDMAADASVCRDEKHLARAAAALATARRTVEAAPIALLQAPRVVSRTAVSVTDAAAKFASKFLD
ncbi:MAG: hypothetical protein NVSMB48_21440 [Marmoricola sp.]